MPAAVYPVHCQLIGSVAEILKVRRLQNTLDVGSAIGMPHHLLDSADEAVISNHLPWAEMDHPVLKRAIPDAALVDPGSCTGESRSFVLWVGREGVGAWDAVASKASDRVEDGRFKDSEEYEQLRCK